MVKLKVDSKILDLYDAIIYTVKDEDNQKYNFDKMFTKEDTLTIVNELENPPYTVTIFIPFKQLIARVQLSKIVGQAKIMIFYDCKNELRIADNICKNEEWDDSTKENFMNTFYAVLANYNPGDLAILELSE